MWLGLLLLAPFIWNGLLIMLTMWALVRACRTASERLSAIAVALVVGSASFTLYYAAHSGDWIYASVRHYTFSFWLPALVPLGLAAVVCLALQERDLVPRHVKVPVLVGLLFAPFVAFMLSMFLDDQIRAVFSVGSRRWL
jgi:hypothetical protein